MCLKCDEMGSKHKHTFFHAKIRWLSWGCILIRIYELKDKMYEKVACDEKIQFCELLYDELWCWKLIYLSGIFEIVNKL